MTNTIYHCRCCYTKDLDDDKNIIKKYFTCKTKQKLMNHLLSPKHIKNSKGLKNADVIRAEDSREDKGIDEDEERDTYHCRCCFTQDLDENYNIVKKHFSCKTKQKYIKHLTSAKHLKCKKELDSLTDDSKYTVCRFTKQRIPIDEWDDYYRQNRILLEIPIYNSTFKKKTFDELRFHKNKPMKIYRDYKQIIDEAIEDGDIKPDNYSIFFGTKKIRCADIVEWLKLYAVKSKKEPIKNAKYIKI